MIVQFYKDSEIFITGGSGVVGKAAIEKLLRSGNVKRIFVLMRCKRGVSSDARLEDMKKSKIFRVLRESNPNELNKLVAIPGDISKDGLGISPEHRDIMKNVTIFFHSAASTRFNEPLRTAIRLNLKATHEALKLAETMKNLKIFLHISTFFCHPYMKFIEDKLYPSKFDWRTALKIVDLDEADPALDIITNKVITSFINTYLFTKHMAEHLVNDYRFKVPVAIFKPSIVVSSLVEPEPGFSESMNGAVGLMVAWGTGLIQAFYMKDYRMNLDMTPLDIGTKALLIFTAMKAPLARQNYESIETCPIGKVSSSSILETPFVEYSKQMTKSYKKYPLEKSFWIPNVTLTSCPYYYWILVVLLQIIPAILTDVVLRIFRIKPFMMQLQRKAYITRDALMFFLENQYKSDGITDLYEMMRYVEGTEFDMSFVIDYAEKREVKMKAVENVARGCRKFLLDEDDSTIPLCRKIYKAKVIAYNVLRGVVMFFVGKAVLQRLMSYVSPEA